MPSPLPNSPPLPLPADQLAHLTSLCQSLGVRRLELFGSAARGDFNPNSSDLDFLVEFQSNDWHGASTRYFGLLHALEDLFQQPIDLVDRNAIKNPAFLSIAEQHRKLLYAA